MSADYYECTACGRAYMEPGFAVFCHASTPVKPIDADVIAAEMSRREEAEAETFEQPEPCELTAWGDKVTTHESGAKRANGDKIRWDLMPIVAMRDTAQIWTFGATKYGDRNWEQGFKWSGPYASLMRHLQAWFAGEDFDQESGMSHLAHAACNLQMLQQFEYTYPQGDDRPHGSCPPLRREDEKEDTPVGDTNQRTRPPGGTAPRW